MTTQPKYKTRTWTKDDFTGEDDGQLGLPGWANDGVEVISDEITDTGRWSEYRTLIFKYEGKYYRTHYSKGLTEQQDESPYEYDTEVECLEVEPYEKVVIDYRPIPLQTEVSVTVDDLEPLLKASQKQKEIVEAIAAKLKPTIVAGIKDGTLLQ